MVFHTFLPVRKMAQNLLAQVKKDGLKATVKQFYETNKVYTGSAVLKGVDETGNHYYEDPDEVNWKRRFVIYSEDHPETLASDGKKVDSTRIPPGWHGWMHHKTDITPVDAPKGLIPFYTQPHKTAALSKMGEQSAYVPVGHFLNPDADKDFKEYTKPFYTSWTRKKNP